MGVDSKGVLRAALELQREGHHPGVVAVCMGALEGEEENVELRLVLARSLLALRRDDQAKRELSTCIKHRPRCAEAYRLLGELALRQDQFRSAQIFLREAIRIGPHDPHIVQLLDVVQAWLQPTAAVEKLPAATAAVGPFSPLPSSTKPLPRRRMAAGTEGVPSPRIDAPPDRLFGAYLVRTGVLTPSQLERALEFQQKARVRVGTAAALLGFTTKPKVEWAAQAYHAAQVSAGGPAGGNTRAGRSGS